MAKRQIVLLMRSTDFSAQVVGDPRRWGAGASEVAAVGNLVLAHADHFRLAFSGEQLCAGSEIAHEQDVVAIELKAAPRGEGDSWYHASIKGSSAEQYGAGKSAHTAIGDLLFRCREALDASIDRNNRSYDSARRREPKFD